MKKWLLLLIPTVLITVLTSGCLLEIPIETINQPPTAYIDSITPVETAAGQVIRFVGHGTDPDGTVVAYRWRSDRDGDLSASASFETSSLSVGSHNIYFRVQDNNGVWSSEVSVVVRIGSTPPPPGLLPVIISFGADQTRITEGQSATLSWNVSGANTVSIDRGIGTVALTGSRTISPDETTVYTLTAINDAGSIEATTQVVVISPPPPPQEHTLIISPNANESGYVRDNGDVVSRYIYAGDDNSNFSLQAFISFDISDIPDRATITEVVVDFSDYDRVYGQPFDDLGCLRGYVDNYGTLSEDDYVTNPSGFAILRFCDLNDVQDPGTNPDVADALQDAVGDNRFKVRLQFRDTETDNADDNDLMAWTPNHLPVLEVTYTVP